MHRYRAVKEVPKGHTASSAEFRTRWTVLGVNWKDWCWGWNSNTLATSCEELTHWKRPWSLEGLGAGGEGDDRGWDGWMASPTRWTWVWVNSGSWWWTGKPGCWDSWGRKESDTTERLNWTALNIKSFYVFVLLSHDIISVSLLNFMYSLHQRKKSPVEFMVYLFQMKKRSGVLFRPWKDTYILGINHKVFKSHIHDTVIIAFSKLTLGLKAQFSVSLFFSTCIHLWWRCIAGKLYLTLRPLISHRASDLRSGVCGHSFIIPASCSF